MPFSDDLRAEISSIFKSQWTIRDGRVVPDTTDIKLGNDAVRLNAVFLYADMAGSTKLVDTMKDTFSAEIYKSFIITACRVIKVCGGDIVAFDGDRVTAVFLGDSKNSSAAKCALHLNWAVTNVLNKSLSEFYTKTDYRISYSVGIDSSEILTARTGIRNNNDLVWVGKSANYAAKMSSIRIEPYRSFISETVFSNLNAESKTATDGRIMWDRILWSEAGIYIYASSWHWSLA